MSYTPGTELASFPYGSQFEGGESAYLCVFYGVADIAASGPPGKPPAEDWEWVDQTADDLANKIQGAGAYETSQGASTQDEQVALSDFNLKWKVLENSIQAIKDAINSGLLVLLCGTEAGFIDSAIGRAPYTWKPSGNHCIVVSGYTTTGNLIVHDYAAVGNAWQPGTTRTYIAQSVQIVSATAVTPLWKESNTMTGIPTGWTDDGTDLKNPINEFFYTGDFRSYVLSQHWNSNDVPLQNRTAYPVLEQSDPSLGPGYAQVSRSGRRLEQTPGHDQGAVFEGWSGQELLFLYSAESQAPAGLPPVAPALVQLVADMGTALQKFQSAVASTLPSA